MTNLKRKGTLLFQFLALLAIASFLIIVLLKIHAHNTLEYGESDGTTKTVF